MQKFFITLALLLALVMPVCAAESPAKDSPKDSTKANASLGLSSVPGLSLPADQTVDPNEGFVNIQATTKGEVKWLVVANIKVKFLPCTQNIIVSVPPQPGLTITVFAVAAVDGKLTDFARTNITVAGNPSPNPSPNPNPNPNPNPQPQPNPAGPLHVTLLVDLSQVTPELAQLLNSQTLRNNVTGKGNWFRLYDLKSPIVAQKKFDALLGQIQGNAMIVQKSDGTVLYAKPMPTTEADILNVINQFGGK